MDTGLVWLAWIWLFGGLLAGIRFSGVRSVFVGTLGLEVALLDPLGGFWVAVLPRSKMINGRNGGRRLYPSLHPHCAQRVMTTTMATEARMTTRTAATNAVNAMTATGGDDDQQDAERPAEVE